MFVLENIQKIQIIGGETIDWLNVFCTFLSVLFGAILAYYFSIKMLKSNNRKDYKYNLLVETLKYINSLQDQIIKRNEMICRMAMTSKDVSNLNDIIISIQVINKNILMYQNDIKLKTEILKTELLKNETDNIDILEKLVKNSKSVSEDIDRQVMFMYAGKNQAQVQLFGIFNVNDIEEKYKIYDTIYDCKRMIEIKLKENKYN